MTSPRWRWPCRTWRRSTGCRLAADAYGRAALGVLGPGSGLGVSGLIPGGAGGSRWRAKAGTRRWHRPPTARVPCSNHMRRHFDHVSAERVLVRTRAGQSLQHLDRARWGAVCGAIPRRRSPQSGKPARPIPSAPRLTAMFCAMLGTIGRHLALTLGARGGGIYIGGGIVPRLGQRFAQSPFRARFEAKAGSAPTSL